MKGNIQKSRGKSRQQVILGGIRVVHRYVGNVRKSVLLGLIITMLYVILTKLEITKHTTYIKAGMIGSLIVVISFFLLYLIKNHKDSNQNYNATISLVLIVGCIIRIGYTLYTPCHVRTYDVLYPYPDGQGHASYILQLLINHKLPQDVVWQHYQQPNFYILGAVLAKLISMLSGKILNAQLVDASKVVSCIASCCTLLLLKELYIRIGLQKKSLLCALIIPTFLPGVFTMAGRVGVDSLATFFTVLILKQSMIWYKEQTYCNTIKLALAFGLGVSTKISCAIWSVPVAFLMLSTLIDNFKTAEFKGYLKKYILFGAISLPLGLWYSVRNFIRFHVPLSYIPAPLNASGEWVDIGSNVQPTYDLILGFNWKRFISVPYTVLKNEANQIESLLKTSLFGECAYGINVNSIILYILLISNTILALFVCFSIIYNLLFYRTKRVLLTSGVFGFQYLIFILFLLGYPYRCSMDFRYAPVLAFAGSALIGFTLEAFHTQASKISKLVFTLLLIGTLSVFTISAVLTYILIE